MIDKINSDRSSNSQIEWELLTALLEPEDNTYPWNPADEESEAYFLNAEAESSMDELLDAEIKARSQDFFHQLDAQWSHINSSEICCTTKPTFATQILETLQSGFAANVPQEWIKHIAQKATDVFNSGQSRSEQLVECVQVVLPLWGTDDLMVLARPLAFAMRSSEQEAESFTNNTLKRDWNTLSEIEQAKVSLAIAYHALNQINSEEV